MKQKILLKLVAIGCMQCFGAIILFAQNTVTPSKKPNKQVIGKKPTTVISATQPVQVVVKPDQNTNSNSGTQFNLKPEKDLSNLKKQPPNRSAEAAIWRMANGITKQMAEGGQKVSMEFSPVYKGDVAYFNSLEPTTHKLVQGNCATYTTSLQLGSLTPSLVVSNNQSDIVPGKMFTLKNYAENSVSGANAIVVGRSKMNISTDAAMGMNNRLRQAFSNTVTVSDMNQLTAAVGTLRSNMDKSRSIGGATSWKVSEVTSESEVAFNVSTGANIITKIGLFSGKVAAAKKNNTSNYTYLVDYTQTLFSINATPVDNAFFTVLPLGLNPAKTVYISKVIYGRRALAFVSSTKKWHSGSFYTDSDYKGPIGTMNGKLNTEEKNSSSDFSGEMYIVGNANAAVPIGNFQSFMDEFNKNFAQNVTYSVAMPIAYEVSNLNGEKIGFLMTADNVKNTYCQQVNGIYRIRLNNVEMPEGIRLGCFSELWLKDGAGNYMNALNPDNSGFLGLSSPIQAFTRWYEDGKDVHSYTKENADLSAYYRDYTVTDPNATITVRASSVSVWKAGSSSRDFNNDDLKGVSKTIKISEILANNGDFSLDINAGINYKIRLYYRVEKISDL